MTRTSGRSGGYLCEYADVALPGTYLIVSSGRQHLTRPRANSDAVGLDGVCHKLMRLETRERAERA